MKLFLLATIVALAPLTSSAAETLLAHTEYNYDFNHFADEVNAYQQADGERRIDYTVGKKTGLKSIHHLLTKFDPSQESCTGAAYLVKLEGNARGPALGNPKLISDQLSIVERVRVGRSGENCDTEVVRSLEIETTNGIFRIKSMSTKTVRLDSDADPELVSRYDFVEREIERKENEEEISPLEKAKMPKACNFTVEALDAALIHSNSNPLAHSLACATRPHPFNATESALLYSELKIADHAADELAISCRDGGEEDRKSVECFDPNASERTPLSDGATKAIRSAIARDKVKIHWVQQDSLGSTIFWMTLSNVSCESSQRCWFEESLNDFD